MKILVACEESQAVTKELRNLGHEAYSADIQEPSGGRPYWHILGDVLPLINGRCSFHTMDGELHSVSGKWDMLIAHPPCTYLTSSGACRLYSDCGVNLERYEKGLAAKAFFMKFYYADCDRICIENPSPLKIYHLPKYTQIIQPYMFGDKVTKRTCLWLKGLPCLVDTDNVGRPETVVYTRLDGSKHYRCWTQNLHSARSRSRTFPGIARAMAYQFTHYEPLQLTLYDYEMAVSL